MPPRTKISISLPTVITLKELSHLTPKEQTIRLYKRFLRLRKFIPTQKHRVIFQKLLKDRFTFDFNTRNQKVLGVDPQLTHEELLARSINTLLFVNTAFTYNDEMSSTIVMNLIKLEQSKQTYASKNQKDRSIERTLRYLDYHKPADHNTPKKWEDLISLKDYDRALMRFNESMKMCL